MKIMIYISSMDGGGAERQTAIFARNFIELRQDVCLVKKKRSESKYFLHPKATIIEAREMRNSKNIFQAVISNVLNAQNIKIIIKEEKPDIIFCMSVTKLFDVILATMFNQNVRVVYFEPSNPYKSHLDSIWRFFKKPLSRLADGCLFQTERAAGFYPASVRKKSVVLPNPLESEKFAGLKEELTRRKVIVSVGRLTPPKEQGVLIKAFSKVLETFSDYELTIFGEGPEMENLRALAKSIGVGNSVNLPGFSENIISEIFDASVFVLSSKYEGMPNALMEAMACGLPCVSTDCDMGPRELIKDGDSGLLVPVGDVEAMAEAIVKILSSDELANRLGRNARRILFTHDERVISQQLLDFFSSLIKILT
jgi:glycosyltransferase involved in cell wall biosynthesis